ncbi:hypothetical protein F2Q68_00010531 [Brassica cretica]|uniref:Secreted protein n=1 Tax=Brassica cretica TaxID=69181 RepID=A0A8S9KUS4_BRACR|nr:hypothetical protein F2Q68_00010531 [Brassica cretica]
MSDLLRSDGWIVFLLRLVNGMAAACDSRETLASSVSRKVSAPSVSSEMSIHWYSNETSGFNPQESSPRAIFLGMSFSCGLTSRYKLVAADSIMKRRKRIIAVVSLAGREVFCFITYMYLLFFANQDVSEWMMMKSIMFVVVKSSRKLQSGNEIFMNVLLLLLSFSNDGLVPGEFIFALYQLFVAGRDHLRPGYFSSGWFCSSTFLSSSEMELDAFIRERRPVDPSCFTSSLEIEFVCLLIQMRDLFLLNDGSSLRLSVSLLWIKTSAAGSDLLCRDDDFISLEIDISFVVSSETLASSVSREGVGSIVFERDVDSLVLE